MHPERCLICGSYESVTVLGYDAPNCHEAKVDDNGIARAWVRCAGCGFHYSQYSGDPARGHAQSSISIGDLSIDLDGKSVTVAGQSVHLTGKEYGILELLALRKARP